MGILKKIQTNFISQQAREDRRSWKTLEKTRDLLQHILVFNQILVLILLSDNINSYFSPFCLLTLCCCFKVRNLLSVESHITFPNEGTNLLHAIGTPYL